MNRLVLLVLASLPATASVRPTAAEQPLEVEWVMTAGGDKHDRAHGIAVDRDGNVLLTGEFTRVATFGRHTAANLGSNDLFLARLKAPRP
jgi:hypothetical protein